MVSAALACSEFCLMLLISSAEALLRSCIALDMRCSVCIWRRIANLSRAVLQQALAIFANLAMIALSTLRMASSCLLIYLVPGFENCISASSKNVPSRFLHTTMRAACVEGHGHSRQVRPILAIGYLHVTELPKSIFERVLDHGDGV